MNCFCWLSSVVLSFASECFIPCMHMHISVLKNGGSLWSSPRHALSQSLPLSLSLFSFLSFLSLSFKISNSSPLSRGPEFSSLSLQFGWALSVLFSLHHNQEISSQQTRAQPIVFLLSVKRKTVDKLNGTEFNWANNNSQIGQPQNQNMFRATQGLPHGGITFADLKRKVTYRKWKWATETAGLVNSSVFALFKHGLSNWLPVMVIETWLLW